jgi:co-chaperonin GroES (HSP10)
MKVACTQDNVLCRWLKPKKTKVGALELVRELHRDTRWAEALVVGPDSILKPGDELLLSARPTSFVFDIDGETMHNVSDSATLCYRRDGKLSCTKGTIIFEWVEEPEEKTESGIFIVKAEKNKLKDVREASVHAAGPDSGVKAGDTILLGYDKDMYTIENIIEGKKLHNCGKEHVICYFPIEKVKPTYTPKLGHVRHVNEAGQPVYERFDGAKWVGEPIELDPVLNAERN